jgi:hypothetical protein
VPTSNGVGHAVSEVNVKVLVQLTGAQVEGTGTEVTAGGAVVGVGVAAAVEVGLGLAFIQRSSRLRLFAAAAVVATDAAADAVARAAS